MFKTLVLFLALTPSCFANERIITKVDYPKEIRHFDMIGGEYIAQKENKYLFARSSEQMDEVHAFLRFPTVEMCKTKDYCVRKEITSKVKFKIESIVSGKEFLSHLSREKETKYVCEKNIIFCYFKMRFEDGDYAYMQIIDFNTVTSPSHALVFNHPDFLQAIPLKPSKLWLEEKKLYKSHFKSRGVREGYTYENVLISAWGKPVSKVRSTSNGSEIAIWTYDGGALNFENGYVTRITTLD